MVYFTVCFDTAVAYSFICSGDTESPRKNQGGSAPKGTPSDEGLPRTIEQAYGQWREKRSALTVVTEEVRRSD
jgi:hypothetical protein